MADIQTQTRDISLFLTGLRISLDSAHRRRGLTDIEGDQYTRVMLLVEEARIRFNIYRDRGQSSPSEWVNAKKSISSFVKAFQGSSGIGERLLGAPFRITIIRDQTISPFIKSLYESKLNMREAIETFAKYLEEADRPIPPQGEFSLTTLQRIVPEQQVAPVQFSVANGYITVIKKAPRILGKDKKNVDTALEHIASSGQKLIDSLEASNCDKRLIENIRELQTKLVNNAPVVQLGLMNIACGMMGSQFREELPDALGALLNSYNTSVSMYVAQFPEWQQFSDKAAQINITDDDVRQIDNTARQLIRELMTCSRKVHPH